VAPPALPRLRAGARRARAHGRKELHPRLDRPAKAPSSPATGFFRHTRRFPLLDRAARANVHPFARQCDANFPQGSPQCVAAPAGFSLAAIRRTAQRACKSTARVMLPVLATGARRDRPTYRLRQVANFRRFTASRRTFFTRL
jgi:hypothetical protein